MKKILILSLLIGGLSFGQDFFESSENEGLFGTTQENTNENNNEDPREDPGNTGELPLDDWLFLLPIAGLAVGGYYLTRKRKIA